jgi:RNA polymerase sigma-70 factor, ECF subfamily
MKNNKGFLQVGTSDEAGDLESTRLVEFRKTYEDHESYVRKTLFWLVGSQLAGDLLQEVFLKVWQNQAKFRGDSEMKTWIYRVTVNTVYDFWRTAKKSSRLDEELADPRNFESELYMREVIGRGIRRMPQNLQTVFVLFYQQELKVEEVAEALEIAEGTVKSRLHQARESFKEYLLKNGVTYE